MCYCTWVDGPGEGTTSTAENMHLVINQPKREGELSI